MPEIGSIIVGLLCFSLLFFEHPNADKRGRFNMYIWTCATMVCAFGWMVFIAAASLDEYPSYTQESEFEKPQLTQLLGVPEDQAILKHNDSIYVVSLPDGAISEIIPGEACKGKALEFNVSNMGFVCAEGYAGQAILIKPREDSIHQSKTHLLNRFRVADASSTELNRAATGYLDHNHEEHIFQYPTLRMLLDSMTSMPVIKDIYPIGRNGSQVPQVTWHVNEHEAFFGNEGISVFDDQVVKVKARKRHGWLSQISLHGMDGKGIDTLYVEYFNHHPVLATADEFILLGKDLKRMVRIDRKTFKRIDSAGLLSNLSLRLSDETGRFWQLEVGVWVLLFGLLVGLLAIPKRSPLHSTQVMKQYALVYLAIATPSALFFAKVIFGWA